VQGSTVATSAAVALAATALITVAVQANLSRFSVKIDAFLKFSKDFNSAAMLDKRMKAGRYLEQLRDPMFELDIYDPKCHPLVDVLNFFDLIGIIVKKHGLDITMVESEFGFWIRGYWQATNVFRAAEEELDPQSWKYFRLLVERLQQKEFLDRLTGSRKRIFPMDADGERHFLRGESLQDRPDAESERP
jgi:hypothetical protein